MTINELINSPAYDGLSDAEIAASLNALTIDSFRPLGSRELLQWAAGSGRLVRLMRAGESHPSDEIRSIALVAVKMLDRSDTQLDLSLPEHQAFVGALVVGAVLASKDRDSLESIAGTKISVAQSYGRDAISHQEVAAIRRK